MMCVPIVSSWYTHCVYRYPLPRYIAILDLEVVKQFTQHKKVQSGLGMGPVKLFMGGAGAVVTMFELYILSDHSSL